MNYKKQVIIEETQEEDFMSPNQQKQQTYQFDEDELAQGIDYQTVKKTENIPIKCQLHKQDITLICYVSQWHCEALCTDCIPIHTQQHNQNKTQPQFKKFDDFKQEAIQKSQKLQEELQQVSNNIQQQINEPYFDNNIKNLYQWRSQILKMISSYFDTIIEQYEQKVSAMKQDWNNQYQKINEQVNSRILEVQQFQQDLQNNKLDSYGLKSDYRKELEQIEYNLSLISKTELETFTINQILIKYIQDNIGRLILIEEPTKQIKPQKNTYQSVKTYSKICQYCQQPMQYVSDFKKHMECQQCSKIKRPNMKK
ncbi:hypothetical protein pb186bvf_007471 [Paramecium bursaria]